MILKRAECLKATRRVLVNVSVKEEDTCISYEEEDTCTSECLKAKPPSLCVFECVCVCEYVHWGGELYISISISMCVCVCVCVCAFCLFLQKQQMAYRHIPMEYPRERQMKARVVMLADAAIMFLMVS
jgi:hypothetical protein